MEPHARRRHQRAAAVRRGETGLVYVGADDGGLYAFDAATGEQRWVYRAHGPIASQPVYADASLYFTSGENRVYALDARLGKWKWQYDREAPESFTIRGYPSPLVVGNRVYVGFSDGYLACLSAASGDVAWARSLAGDQTRFIDVDSTPLFYHDTLYVSAYATGVYALDPKDGSTKWRFDVEGATTVRARGSRLYFTASKSGLHALDLDGHLLWRQALAEGGELSAPTVVQSYVLVSSSHGGTYVADARERAALSVLLARARRDLGADERRAAGLRAVERRLLLRAGAEQALASAALTERDEASSSAPLPSTHRVGARLLRAHPIVAVAHELSQRTLGLVCGERATEVALRDHFERRAHVDAPARTRLLWAARRRSSRG